MPSNENKPLNLSWWEGENFGDALNPLVVAHVSGRDVAPVRRSQADLFCVGSILHKVQPVFHRRKEKRPVIWGTGMRSPIEELRFTKHVDFTAVRGPITASLLGIRDVAFGDPGLFLADLSDPKIQRTDKIGLIPHHADFNERKAGNTVNLFLDDKDVTIIDPRTKDSLGVANQIKGCRHLYSASLHGLIVADALGVPNTWVVSKTHKIHKTAEIKFLDYFLSVNRPFERPITFHDIHEHRKSISKNDAVTYANGVEDSKEALRTAFPDALRA
ncbi:MAG TPA: exosortase [Octadecabacter sp.]|nr:exosortase [Octadecabacter sp.]